MTCRICQILNWKCIGPHFESIDHQFAVYYNILGSVFLFIVSSAVVYASVSAVGGFPAAPPVLSAVPQPSFSSPTK